MPTRRSFEGGQLPTHMRKVEGADRSWMVRARCKTNTDGGRPGFAWTVDRRDRGPKLQGRKAEVWIEFAVTICKACEAQYDCARFALQVEERHNTWAMDIADLMWLQGQDDASTIITASEDMGIPISTAVVTVRSRRSL